LRLRSGDTVGIDVEGNRLVVKQFSKPRYTLDELLAQCDAEAEISAEERDWLNAKPVGDELL
jgi:antitoxin ChpS